MTWPMGCATAHASWLLAGGADIQVVKERLGHAAITTTGRGIAVARCTVERLMRALGLFGARLIRSRGRRAVEE